MSKDYSEKIAQLEQVAVQHRNDPMGAKARADLDRLLREIADEKAEDRHREAMGESQKAEDRHREAMGESRRGARWAGGASAVAGVGDGDCWSWRNCSDSRTTFTVCNEAVSAKRIAASAQTRSFGHFINATQAFRASHRTKPEAS